MSVAASELASRTARYIVVLVVAAIGLFVSIVAYVAVSNWELRLAELKLTELARIDQQMLNANLQSATDILYTMRALYRTSGDPLTRAELQNFAADMRSRLVGLRNTGWARRVTHEQRAAFEQSVRLEGFPDFEIWERDAKGERIRAHDRAEYIVIVFPDPVGYTAQILGFDISSEPVRADAMRRARLRQEPAATPPISLITKAEPDGFMTFIPVYAKGSAGEAASAEPEGFMYGVFATGPMIENILNTKSLASSLNIYLFGPGKGENRQLLYRHIAFGNVTAPAVNESELLAGPHWSGRIDIADQEWTAVFVPAHASLIDSGHLQSLVTLLAGLLLTSLIVIYLLLSIKRTTRLEALTTKLRDTTDDLRREGDKVSRLARTDFMTGLANRATFVEHLNDAFSAAHRGGAPFAVILIDLDHFKDINDTLGHPAGDELIRSTADRLKAVVGMGDVIARLGGDEFAVCVADSSDVQHVADLAWRITNTLKQRFDLGGNVVHVSASTGISMFDMLTKSPEDMMMHADLALYQAKKEGRNQFCFYSARLDLELRERVTLTEDLHAALANDEFELYYQPQVDVPSGRISGMEALVRWNHPRRGLLLPGTFIPIAEKTGAMHGIGKWVLEQACRQIKIWQAAGLDLPVIAVNVSGTQFKGTAPYDEELRRTLARFAVDPRALEIELTEGTLIETAEGNDVIRRIRAMGVSVAIDDFGTGYSSLEYLRNDRVNRLKIAQQFMPEVAVKSGDAAIVRASLMLARELGMSAIAEGVETAEQLAFLMSLGCHTVQGHYFSKAVPAAAATALLHQGEIVRGAPTLLPGSRPAAA